jgi:lysophospholipase L1-like esterase
MKIYFLSVVLVSFAVNSFGQNVKWDSTYRPASYATKVDQFKSYPNKKSDIIFFGNSITAGTDWNELLGIDNARNRGISGDISFGLLERLDEVTEGKPAKVFVLIGINDISRNIPDSIILDNYRKIIQRIKATSPGTKIYFHTLLPVNNTFPDKNQFNKDEHILAVNTGLRKLGTAEKITIIDLYPNFLDADKRLKKEWTIDGLHLNAAGYNVWAKILAPYLKD